MTLQPEFLKISPAEIARVGANGAVLLALIRFATAIENGHDRIVIDGHVWWRASHPEIGASLGLSHDAVRRLVSKLEATGEVVTCVPSADENRAKAYMIPDQSLRECASSLSSQNAKSRDHDAISRDVDANSRDALPIKEGREVKKSGARAGTTYLTSDWRPSPETLAELSYEQTVIDFDYSLKKFRNHHTRIRKTKRADWDAQFISWVLDDVARVRQRAPVNGAHNGSTTTSKPRSLLSLAARDREGETPQLTNHQSKGIS